MNLNPFNQLDPVTIVATVVIFAGTYAVLRKSVFVPLVTVMENRLERVDAGLDAAEEAYRLTSEAQARAAEGLRLAKLDGDRIIDVAREKAERRRDELLATAEREAAEYLDAGRAKIAQARAAEVSELRREALDCVALACEKLLVPVDKATAASIVDGVIAQRIHEQASTAERGQ
ncbi:MAG: ATP synthase F0 subunit B [Actinomycetia bacterium]|nr:ATP synthase F0 subunit B [Actinomycetes bacterium]